MTTPNNRSNNTIEKVFPFLDGFYMKRILCGLVILIIGLVSSHNSVHAISFAQSGSNDGFENAISISGIPYKSNLINTNAFTTAPDDPDVPCGDDVLIKQSKSAWFKFTPNQTDTVVVDTLLSNFDSVVSVWIGSQGALSNIACNDDANGLTTSALSFRATVGEVYYIEASSYGDFVGGDLVLRLREISTIHPITLMSKTFNGVTELKNGDGPSISENGEYIVFSSYLLTSGATRSMYHIFLQSVANPSQSLTVSVNSTGNYSNSDSYSPSVSNDGKYVVFVSDASNLDPDDDVLTTEYDVFLRNLEKVPNETYCLSINLNGDCVGGSDPEISANGKYVTFVSDAQLTTDDINEISDVYLYDIQNETVTLISKTSSSSNDKYSRSPSISSTGEFITFSSSATNLVSSDFYGDWDIFIYNTLTNQMKLVTSESHNGDSDFPSISDNGQYIVFEQELDNDEYLYLSDLQTQTTTQIGTNWGKYVRYDLLGDFEISADGKFVSYVMEYYNLNGNYKENLFRYNVSSRKTDILGLRYDGIDDRVLNNSTEYTSASISGNGRYIVSATDEDKLVPNDLNQGTDVFLFDLFEPIIYRADHVEEPFSFDSENFQYLIDTRAASSAPSDKNFVCNVGGSQQHANSVWFRYQPTKDTGIYINTLGSNYDTILSVWIDSPEPHESTTCNDDINDPSPEFTSYQSAIRMEVIAGQTYLIEATQEGSSQGGFLSIQFLEALGGTTYLASKSYDNTSSDGYSTYPALSADGQFIAFDSDATNLLDSPTTGKNHIFVYDQISDQNEIISISPTGEEGDGYSRRPSISANGRYIVFESSAKNLVGDGDSLTFFDIFLRDRNGAGKTTKIAGGNADSINPVISGNGRFIAFESDASDLVPVDPNGVRDIFVFDAETSEISNITFRDGIAANKHSYTPSISADGRYVVCFVK